MKIPSSLTLGGVAIALTIPKLLPDVLNLAGRVSLATASFALEKGFNGLSAGAGWIYEKAPIAWEQAGSPLMQACGEKIRPLAASVLEVLSQPTGGDLFGYPMTQGFAIASTVIAGVAAGLAIVQIQNRAATSKQ